MLFLVMPFLIMATIATLFGLPAWAVLVPPRKCHRLTTSALIGWTAVLGVLLAVVRTEQPFVLWLALLGLFALIIMLTRLYVPAGQGWKYIPACWIFVLLAVLLVQVINTT